MDDVEAHLLPAIVPGGSHVQKSRASSKPDNGDAGTASRSPAQRELRVVTCPTLTHFLGRGDELVGRTADRSATGKASTETAAGGAASFISARVNSISAVAVQHHRLNAEPGRFHELLQDIAAEHDLDLAALRAELSALRVENAQLRAELGREVSFTRKQSKSDPAPVIPVPAPIISAPLPTVPPTPLPTPEGNVGPLEEVPSHQCGSSSSASASGARQIVPRMPSGDNVASAASASHLEEPTKQHRTVTLNSTVSEDFGDGDEARSCRLSHAMLPKSFKTLPVWKMETGFKDHKKFSIARSRSSANMKGVLRRSDEEHTIQGSSCIQRFLVHPSSTKRLTWDLISMVLLTWDIVMIPFSGAFDPPVVPFTTAMNWITMLFWTLDMPASLLTGFQDGRYTVVEPKRILKRYLKTWFVLDLLIVGLDWTLLVIGDGVGGSAARLGRSLRTLRFVRTIRLIRLLKLKRILQEIQDQINTEALSICFGILKIILVLILANHIVACSWYSIGILSSEAHAVGLSTWVIQHSMEERSLSYQYFTSLHWSLTQFTPASMEVVPYNVPERVFSVIVLLFAMITFSSFVSILTASMAELRNISSDETRQFWLLRRYLKDWHVSRRFAMRIQRYLEYAYQKQRQRVQAKDVKLLALLSGPLHDELKYETLSVHLVAHPFFYHCDAGTRIFSKSLGDMWLARGDCIFSCGEQGSQMVFVSTGLCQYQLGELETGLMQEGSKPEHLYEGQWIAEAVLWTPWLHLGDLQALTESQAVTVDSRKFGESIHVYKPLWLAVRRYAEKFVQAMNKIQREELTDLLHNTVSSQEIVDDSDFVSTSGTCIEEDETRTPLSRMCSAIWGRASRRARGAQPMRVRSASSASGELA